MSQGKILIYVVKKSQKNICNVHFFTPMNSCVPENTHRVLFYIYFISQICQRVMSQGKIIQYWFQNILLHN